MAARLPIPGDDNDTWGTILNGFLSVEHEPDGTLKAGGSLAAKANDSAVIHNTGSEPVSGTKAFSTSPTVPTPTLGSQAANKSYVDATASSGTPDADGSTKGKLQLAGDLGGTAASPTVPGLANKADTATVNTALSGKEPTVTAGTSGQYYRGDKSWQTLDKVVVGLANADNTSDANKPVSTATQTALNLKANTASLSTVATSGVYNDLTGKPTIPAQFAPVAGTNISLTGTYPNITINASSGAGTTDITITRDATSATVVSSTGADGAIAAADASNAGVLTAADKTKLDGIASGAQVNTVTSVAAKTGAVTLIKDDVGLANVDNTSDAAKNTATATLTNKTISGASNTLSNIPESAVTSLTSDLNAKVDKSTLTTKGDLYVATAASSLARQGVGGDGQILTADSTQANGIKWAAPATAPVTSVNAQTGAVTLTKSDISLGSVDNTSDATKNTATATLTNKRITKRVATLTDAATVTPDIDSYDVGKLLTLSQSTTIANPTGTPTDSQQYILRIKSTSSQTLAFGSQYRGGTDVVLPAATTGTSKTDYLGFEWNAEDTKWDLIALARSY